MIILCATDFSFASETAVEHATALARVQGATLCLLHVIESLDTVVPAAVPELGGHLIVVGTHGRKGPARFFLGSVAEAVVRAATCSVLVARGEKMDAGSFTGAAA